MVRFRGPVYFLQLFDLLQITAAKLGEFFMKFATVVEAKIILDEHLQSKRFGFVTLACKEDVDIILSRKKIFIKGKRINVGPAIKKQVISNNVS